MPQTRKLANWRRQRLTDGVRDMSGRLRRSSNAIYLVGAALVLVGHYIKMSVAMVLSTQVHKYFGRVLSRRLLPEQITTQRRYFG